MGDAAGAPAPQTKDLEDLEDLLSVSLVDAHPANGSLALRVQLAQLLETRGESNRLQVHRILKDLRDPKGLTLKDLSVAIKDNWHRRQRSKVYLYLVPLLAMCYLIPSVQMVFSMQSMARELGSEEQCYLNFGCSRPWWIFSDINHIISNAGYIIYGITFIVLVRLKSWMLPPENRTDTDHQGRLGLPQQHSIFYTLGLAMVLQGVFSSVFHVCPSNVSLQFDTSMMYVMLILVFVKVYQFRHPDISTNAYPAMYMFVLALALEACSLYITSTQGKAVFYTIFSVFYLGLLLNVTVNSYYYADAKGHLCYLLPAILKQSLRSGRSCLYGRRFLLAIIFLILNFCLMAYFLVASLRKTGAVSLSSPILVICAVNVSLFLTYYMVLKIRETWRAKEGEAESWLRWGLRFSSFVFFLVAIALALLAIHFYSRRHQSRNSSPAESRDRNELCNVMDFFDNHDMWHFLSATALFLAFISLLTIDDDLLLAERDRIPVF